MATFTVSSFTDKRKQIIFVKEIKNHFIRLLKNSSIDANYWVSIELGKNFNNPHTHIQLYFEEENIDKINNGSVNVLIIPSGGFYGLDNLNILKAGLDEFVYNGGKVLCFTQQHGYEWGVLPTYYDDSIDGFGWVQDQECYRESVYLNEWHPVLAGQNELTPDIHVDGYFTTSPESSKVQGSKVQGSTVLLRRTKNGYPTMVGKTRFCRC